MQKDPSSPARAGVGKDIGHPRSHLHRLQVRGTASEMTENEIDPRMHAGGDLKMQRRGGHGADSFSAFDSDPTTMGKAHQVQVFHQLPERLKLFFRRVETEVRKEFDGFEKLKLTEGEDDFLYSMFRDLIQREQADGNVRSIEEFEEMYGGRDWTLNKVIALEYQERNRAHQAATGRTLPLAGMDGRRHMPLAPEDFRTDPDFMDKFNIGSIDLHRNTAYVFGYPAKIEKNPATAAYPYKVFIGGEDVYLYDPNVIKNMIQVKILSDHFLSKSILRDDLVFNNTERFWMIDNHLLDNGEEEDIMVLPTPSGTLQYKIVDDPHGHVVNTFDELAQISRGLHR